MRILPTLARPGRLVQKVLRRFPVRDIHLLVAYDILPRPNYAYGLYQAAGLARSLGVNRIAAIEFGVAGGRGLLALEHNARLIGDAFKVEISVAGFDLGRGLPRPVDYRDHPYLWQEGFFEMDVAKLQGRLQKAKLVLGDVTQTIPEYFSRTDIDPVGFVSFDLDYYSSTVQALRLFEMPSSSRLPRVFCYFDDAVEPDFAAYHEFAGELLAIKEFNDRHEHMKIGKMQALSLQRMYPEPWNELMYVMHDFHHPDYGRVLKEAPTQIPLQ